MERVSVRNIVEFILRSGDIESSASGVRDAEAMRQGTRLHKLIQVNSGPDYVAEVPLGVEMSGSYAGETIELCVEGRADGVITDSLVDNSIVINEIKTMYMDVSKLTVPFPMHQYQALCYAAMWFMRNDDLNQITIRMTYCQITEATRYKDLVIKEFEEIVERDKTLEWFQNLVNEYAKWIIWSMKWKETRDASIKSMSFPYEYRKGQYDLVKGVYLSILRKKKLFLQAPTGVGKTLSTVFPAVTAMGEKIAEKIFYLTAKTIARTVAEDAVRIMTDNGVMLKSITLTAKEKICVKENVECNPNYCERAKGHYDRVNDAVYDMLCNESTISRDIINEYAEKYKVCPFEMALDVTNWSDIIICDYNYAFDPKVCLKRFFADNMNKDYVFLIDEAHNLVDRARKMYSARLSKELVMDVRRSVKNYDKRLYNALDKINNNMLDYKRSCDEFEVIDSVDNLVFGLMRTLAVFDAFLKDVLPGIKDFAGKDNLLQLYFDIRFFVNIYELLDEKYRIFMDYTDGGEFGITLQCMDPSVNLKEYLRKGRSAIFFSATLLPVKYYMGQFGGDEEDYAVYAESSFDPSNCLVMLATDVSSRYTRRNETEYKKIASYIETLIVARKGNYIVFFPSYKMMCDVLDNMEDPDRLSHPTRYIVQQPGMDEEDREEFLQCFQEKNDETVVGFCVMGGIFGEGIDLRDDMLIGVVIVGTGLPMVGNERELYRQYYDDECDKGFEYAYLYPGMNKVLQAAGRVIRTVTDRGCILLLDDRFMQNQYRALFPREWKDCVSVNVNTMSGYLERFWNE